MWPGRTPLRSPFPITPTQTTRPERPLSATSRGAVPPDGLLVAHHRALHGCFGICEDVQVVEVAVDAVEPQRHDFLDNPVNRAGGGGDVVRVAGHERDVATIRSDMH